MSLLSYSISFIVLAILLLIIIKQLKKNMIIKVINRILKNRVKSISFPKLPVKKYNNLWKTTINKFIRLPIMEIIPILRCLFLNFGPASLLAIPTIFWIIKKSDILEEKDTQSHLKMLTEP